MGSDFRPVLDGAPTLSLELLRADHIGEFGEMTRIVDWPVVFQRAGFDQVETAFLLERIGGTPLENMPAALGMDAVEVKRIRQRAAAKIMRLRGELAREIECNSQYTNSRRLSFQETLPSGRRCWSLAALEPTFAHVMSQEKQSLTKMFDAKTAKVPSLAADE